jgi:hypothetical protein
MGVSLRLPSCPGVSDRVEDWLCIYCMFMYLHCNEITID